METIVKFIIKYVIFPLKNMSHYCYTQLKRVNKMSEIFTPKT